MGIKPPSLIIYSRSPITRDQLVGELDVLRGEFPNLKIIGFDMQFMSAVDNDAQAVVLDLEQWFPSDELAISDLRGYGYDGPVIVLSTKMDESASNSYVSERIVFVDRGKDAKQLTGIAKRLVLGSIVAARKFPRHPTNESAELQIEGSATWFSCKVRNMSKGGAYVELERSLNLRIGDLLHLKIRLSQVGRVHTVKARVAWVNQRGVGVEFVAQPES